MDFPHSTLNWSQGLAENQNGDSSPATHCLFFNIPKCSLAFKIHTHTTRDMRVLCFGNRLLTALGIQLGPRTNKEPSAGLLFIDTRLCPEFLIRARTEANFKSIHRKQLQYQYSNVCFAAACQASGRHDLLYDLVRGSDNFALSFFPTLWEGIA